jgi:hypothetical protein
LAGHPKNRPFSWRTVTCVASTVSTPAALVGRISKGSSVLAVQTVKANGRKSSFCMTFCVGIIVEVKVGIFSRT